MDPSASNSLTQQMEPSTQLPQGYDTHYHSLPLSLPLAIELNRLVGKGHVKPTSDLETAATHSPIPPPCPCGDLPSHGRLITTLTDGFSC